MFHSKPASGANVSINPYIGFSGSSAVLATFAFLVDEDGKLFQLMLEHGLLTGEIGLQVDLNLGKWGLRPEAFLGYYKFHFWDIPNTAYFMIHGGMEVYRSVSRYWSLGYGVGYFQSIIYQEILGYQVSRAHLYYGNSSWISLYMNDHRYALDFRIRWHNFWKQENIDQNLHDFVFVFRFLLPFRL